MTATPPADDDPELEFPAPIARRLGIHRNTIRNWLEMGEVPGVKTRAGWVLREKDIPAELIERQRAWHARRSEEARAARKPHIEDCAEHMEIIRRLSDELSAARRTIDNLVARLPSV